MPDGGSASNISMESAPLPLVKGQSPQNPRSQAEPGNEMNSHEDTDERNHVGAAFQPRLACLTPHTGYKYERIEQFVSLVRSRLESRSHRIFHPNVYESWL